LQGEDTRATGDLAFHARLMELALQAGSTAGCFLKDIRWRAVDVDRPVTHSCALDAALAARLRTVTGGSTSTARLRTDCCDSGL
jgi:hypothetical protein